MAGRGGRATQSGISYQNLYATRYAVEMLGGEAVAEAGRIIALRSEAPTAVDDVLLTFADGHRRYVQTKEAIA